MNDAWNALQWDFEEKKVPHSLKKGVMDYVFKRNRNAIRKPKHSYTLKNQFSLLARGLLIFLTATSLLFALDNHFPQSFLTGIQPYNTVPSQVLNTMMIQASDVTNNQLTGYAAVIQEGQSKKLIVQVENMPKLKGSEVYQVWLLKDGERENAGIFKPNENGTGILSFPLKKEGQFDQIGITTEPDETSLQPRGKKIAGTG
ncbi:anti-sigma factor [Siminovitchia fortis]|nr:anti-sigma factor [Siminovitchia fortis]WHY82411.1 anti-sigma factor [Siminovitchia fortis]